MAWFIFFALALALVFLLNVGYGSAAISLRDILGILVQGDTGDRSASLIIGRIRLPRALASMAAGSALGIAGLLLQTFFNNPIVEPYILGISSGSMLFVAMTVLGGYRFGFKRLSPMAFFAGAFIGAMLVMLTVLFAARRVKRIVSLLIIGLMAGYLCGAGISILSAFAEQERIANFSLWTMGSFSGFTWPQIRVLYLLTLPMLAGAFLLAKPLNALSMGERYALTMGINVKALRLLLILISSVLTAAITAFAGPVSFIGLAVPHICRIVFRTANNRILIPAVVLSGALMASFCDFTARNICAPLEIPLGAVTAIIGAPLAVWLLTRRPE
jgi:iron complex transport system permease protein